MADRVRVTVLDRHAIRLRGHVKARRCDGSCLDPAEDPPGAGRAPAARTPRRSASRPSARRPRRPQSRSPGAGRAAQEIAIPQRLSGIRLEFKRVSGLRSPVSGTRESRLAARDPRHETRDVAKKFPLRRSRATERARVALFLLAEVE